MNMFRQKCLIKHNIDIEHMTNLLDIKEIILEHKKSPVEFKRGDRFIICSENYKMKAVSVNDIQKYLNKAKLFIEAMDTIVRKDEGLFRST